MLYADNQYKFVAVLNERVDLPKLMNALGHMTAGLVGQGQFVEQMDFLQYEDGDGGRHPAISRYPFIVLSAKNGEQLRTLRQAVAVDDRVVFNDFTDTMLGGSADEQQDQTKRTVERELEYFGVCLFGPAELLQPLTKKFSLFRGSKRVMEEALS